MIKSSILQFFLRRSSSYIPKRLFCTTTYSIMALNTALTKMLCVFWLYSAPIILDYTYTWILFCSVHHSALVWSDIYAIHIGIHGLVAGELLLLSHFVPSISLWLFHVPFSSFSHLLLVPTSLYLVGRCWRVKKKTMKKICSKNAFLMIFVPF